MDRLDREPQNKQVKLPSIGVHSTSNNVTDHSVDLQKDPYAVKRIKIIDGLASVSSTEHSAISGSVMSTATRPRNLIRRTQELPYTNMSLPSLSLNRDSLTNQSAVQLSLNLNDNLSLFSTSHDVEK